MPHSSDYYNSFEAGLRDDDIRIFFLPSLTNEIASVARVIRKILAEFFFKTFLADPFRSLDIINITMK